VVSVAIPTSFDKSRRGSAHRQQSAPTRRPRLRYSPTPLPLPPRHTGRLSCAALSSPSVSTSANHPPHPSPSPPSLSLSPFSPSSILRYDGAAGGRRRRGDVGGVGRHHAEVRVVRPDGVPRRGACRRRPRLPPPLLPVPPLQEHTPGPSLFSPLRFLPPLLGSRMDSWGVVEQSLVITKRKFTCRISRTVTWCFCDSGYYCERRSSQSSWAVLSCFLVLASNCLAASFNCCTSWSGFVSYRLHDHVDCDCAGFAHGVTCYALNLYWFLLVSELGTKSRIGSTQYRVQNLLFHLSTIVPSVNFSLATTWQVRI
jgi:hypothetical protein